MVKAARVHSIGGYHSVQYEDVEVSPPSESHVEVRHTAIVATTDDVLDSSHHRSDLKYPYTPGVSAVGVITEVGSGVLDHRIGERVGYVSTPERGSFCEVISIATKYLIPIPDCINDEEAASVLYEGLVAWMLVSRVFRVRRGDTVLIHDVTNGLGLLLSQWARHLGATVLATVAADEDISRVESKIVDHVLSYSYFADKALDVTDGLGVNVVYNCGGKDTAVGSLACLAPRGIFVETGRATSLTTSDIVQRGKSVVLAFPFLRDYVKTREDCFEASSELFSLLRSKALCFSLKRKESFEYPRTLAHICFSLRNAGEALKELGKGTGFQTFILVPPVTTPEDVPHGS